MLLCNLLEELKLSVTIKKVASEQNHADRLTRVPKKWLMMSRETAASGIVARKLCSMEEIKKLHEKHHFGVRRTLYLTKQVYPDKNVAEEDVKRVVKECRRCLSIDPAPVQWEKGHLDVSSSWVRVACDVTHYDKKRYLTMVDCGPSRLAIWKAIATEGEDEICKEIAEVFRERGPPEELLMDNFTTNRSRQLQALCTKWDVKLTYRCAHRPSGNGIVERNHRTIKRMAARAGGDVLDMVYWYNAAPKEGANESSLPCSGIFAYRWRYPGKGQEATAQQPLMKLFRIGEQVFVKPGNAKCTTVWTTGTVTGVGSTETAVEVDGIPRHVADVRRMELEQTQAVSATQRQAEDSNETSGPAEKANVIDAVEEPPPQSERPRRATNIPRRFGYDDYHLG
jgi:hypothetical protein